ncbi:serine--tRNA ligase [Polluticaenibacter yanchengensis]|uniref:Serine--tRNA ligase n=1 Tax=Polluticaenibacter yanchengensis TaxID=3014562 RepID=A0ABT4UG52_9BACT|nr:serine--tRNA ligase [Chitinophagaceae bacterium LY-5]
MIPIQLLRENPDFVKERLGVKNFPQPELVDTILAFDESRRKIQQELDSTLSNINAISKSIGGLMKDGKKEEAEQMKAQVAALKENEKQLKEQVTTLEKQQFDTLVQLPNLPMADVPVGKSADDNVEVRKGGVIPALQEGAVPHWDLIKQYDIVDFELGAKVTGSGFPFYKGKGAKLQRALSAYFLDFNTDAGYTEVIPPYMVNTDSAFATGQLPDKEGQMYEMPADGFYMIPTAEVPVTNIYRDTILKETELPIKLTAYSPCFRREAGSFGANVRGLNRLHQFEKVEVVQITHPDKSSQTLDDMVAHVERLLNTLELPYRILRLCGGDMGFVSAITYDFEVWSAAQQKWLEVSSVSNFTNYQANRLKCRFKNAEGKTQLCHTLNGSSLALPRIMAALLENNQTPEGIKIPQVLQTYFRGDIIN